METMFMQHFGRTNKEYYGIFESGLLERSGSFKQTTFWNHGRKPEVNVSHARAMVSPRFLS